MTEHHNAKWEAIVHLVKVATDEFLQGLLLLTCPGSIADRRLIQKSIQASVALYLYELSDTQLALKFSLTSDAFSLGRPVDAQPLWIQRALCELSTRFAVFQAKSEIDSFVRLRKAHVLRNLATTPWRKVESEEVGIILVWIERYMRAKRKVPGLDPVFANFLYEHEEWSYDAIRRTVGVWKHPKPSSESFTTCNSTPVLVWSSECHTDNSSVSRSLRRYVRRMRHRRDVLPLVEPGCPLVLIKCLRSDVLRTDCMTTIAEASFAIDLLQRDVDRKAIDNIKKGVSGGQLL